jgi:hypothetical protein
MSLKLTISYWYERTYYRLIGCRWLNDHYQKFYGCIYCGKSRWDIEKKYRAQG